jgi:hypothetical protein
VDQQDDKSEPNEDGHPATRRNLTAIDPRRTHVIAEIGTNHPGEIAPDGRSSTVVENEQALQVRSRWRTSPAWWTTSTSGSAS